MSSMPSPARRALAVVLLVAAVQFVNILDFVMVMPMGPDFAAALGIPSSRLGLIGGSYTAAAAVAGLVSSLFLDRFDRRPALGISMVGLVVGTALGGLAKDLTTLMIARMVAGAFGGPATSLAFSIVAGGGPPQARGRPAGGGVVGRPSPCPRLFARGGRRPSRAAGPRDGRGDGSVLDRPGARGARGPGAGATVGLARSILRRGRHRRGHRRGRRVPAAAAARPPGRAPRTDAGLAALRAAQRAPLLGHDLRGDGLRLRADPQHLRLRAVQSRVSSLAARPALLRRRPGEAGRAPARGV